MHRVAFDFDGSLALQPRLQGAIDRVVDRRQSGDALRLWAGEMAANALRDSIAGIRREHPEPWVTFLGSGDYHHISLFLLMTLTPQKPVVLVVLDNHPDWFREEPAYHCGNWVASALSLPQVKRVILVGQTSGDLRGISFRRAPQEELCSGKLSIFPLRRQRSFVPFKRLAKVDGVGATKPGFFGTHVCYESLESVGREAFFDRLARQLAQEPVYLSVDKDCLAPSQLRTDWDQGGLLRSELLHGVSALASSVRLVGADVCGEQSPARLKGLMKRLDAWRVFEGWRPGIASASAHEALNLALLDLLDPRG